MKLPNVSSESLSTFVVELSQFATETLIVTLRLGSFPKSVCWNAHDIVRVRADGNTWNNQTKQRNETYIATH